MSGVDIWNETPVNSDLRNPVNSALRNPDKMYGLKDHVPLRLNPVKRSDTGSEAHVDGKFTKKFSTNPRAFRDNGHPTPGGRKKKSLKNKKNGNRKTSKRKSRKSSIRKTKTRKHRK